MDLDPKTKLRLVIISGGTKGRSFAVEEGMTVIGRADPDNNSYPEVDLDEEDGDAKISRRHAQIERRGALVTIEDIGSLNGTFLNRGPRLEPGKKYELKPTDEIIVGRVALRFEIQDAESLGD